MQCDIQHSRQTYCAGTNIKLLQRPPLCLGAYNAVKQIVMYRHEFIATSGIQYNEILA